MHDISMDNSYRAWQSAWKQTQEVALKRSFLRARDAVSVIAHDLIDEQTRDALIAEVSSKVDIRLPYSPDEPLYPLMKEKMLEIFRKDVYCYALTLNDEETTTTMVTEYLDTRFTYTPRNGQPY